MRKFLIYNLTFLLVIFCGKKSTEPSNEDSIKLEITVMENDSPRENIYVTVFAMVKLIHLNQTQSGDIASIALVETQEDQQITNLYGKVQFSYKDKSLPEENGIIIKKIVLSRLSEELYVDSVEKFIKKNESLKLTVEL